ncbi:hypothetical protein Cni_G22376 [Canna indica]|uniref:Uncharacterized protein n=1 Tax=Canna indica TaxID=4628 RepID=A0AAQ3QLK8_9LILI|nr:hypothetical protein Cni_G22376 [Canna indica]
MPSKQDCSRAHETHSNGATTASIDSIISKSPAPEERVILNGVTGRVCLGELLAVLGPSDSEKFTLLSMPVERLQGKHSGNILTNGRWLEK